MKTKIGSKIIALTVLMVFGCISVPVLFADKFNYNKMSLGTNITSRILPLDYLEGNLYTSQANRILKNGFLTAGTEKYGYFNINLSYDFIGMGKRDKSITTWGIIGSTLTLGFGLLFLPIGQYRYNLCATVEILDINKKILKKYSSSTMYDAIDTMHDADYTFKTESIYCNLLKNCLTAASRDADEINSALISAMMSAKIPAGSRIAIIGSNQTTDVSSATRQIESQLIETRRFQVVDRVSIDVLISEIIFSRSVFVTEAIEVGRILSAHYIIYVEIIGDGGNRKLNCKLLSVGSSEIIAGYASSLK
jgi:hypothetical protein